MTRLVFERGTSVDKTLLSRITGKHEPVYGVYNPITDVVRVWCGGMSDEEIARTLAHELQHANDRRLLIGFKIFCYAAMAVCGVFLGKVIRIGNSFPVPIGMISVVWLWFIASMLRSWLEDRAEKAEKKFTYTERFSSRVDCPQCSQRFGACDTPSS